MKSSFRLCHTSAPDPATMTLEKDITPVMVFSCAGHAGSPWFMNTRIGVKTVTKRDWKSQVADIPRHGRQPDDDFDPQQKDYDNRHQYLTVRLYQPLLGRHRQVCTKRAGNRGSLCRRKPAPSRRRMGQMATKPGHNSSCETSAMIKISSLHSPYEINLRLQKLTPLHGTICLRHFYWSLRHP